MIAEAMEIIVEATGGAAKQSYGLDQVSLLQLTRSRLSSGTDLAQSEAVRSVRDLARKQTAPALAQLASRMASAMHSSSSNGDDPFATLKASPLT